MARSTATVFITEIPLLVDSYQESELLSRFQAARQLYNACLNEAMVRVHLVRNSEIYQAAKIIPKEQKKKRSEAFNAARKNYRYSDYDIQSYATIVRNKSKWIAQKIDYNTQQTLATRAFRASEKVLFGSAKNDEDNLLLHLAQSEWERTEPFLMQAWKDFQINCEQSGVSESRLSHSPSEQFCMKLGTVNQIAIKERKVNFNS